MPTNWLNNVCAFGWQMRMWCSSRLYAITGRASREPYATTRHIDWCLQKGKSWPKNGTRTQPTKQTHPQPHKMRKQATANAKHRRVLLIQSPVSAMTNLAFILLSTRLRFLEKHMQYVYPLITSVCIEKSKRAKGRALTLKWPEWRAGTNFANNNRLPVINKKTKHFVKLLDA